MTSARAIIFQNHVGMHQLSGIETAAFARKGKIIMARKANMKQFGLVLFMAFCVGLNGMTQGVTWGPAVNIGTNPGETDVSTSGNLQYAYAWGNVSTTVNGVPFSGTAATSGNIPSTNPNITLTTPWTYYLNNSGPTLGLTAAYRTMLAGDIDQYAINSGPQTMTLNQLTVGHTYLIQAWISSASDGWNNTAKQLTVTNANGTINTCYGYGNPANGLGQYTRGTFTAGATTQAFAIIGVSYGFPQINAIQVRDTTISGPPSAPTGLSATAGNTQVSLTWNVSSGATSYNVKRATVSGGPYTTTASPATTNYTDTGLSNGTNYYYVVSAVNSFGESTNSVEVSATPLALPPAPTGLSATAGSTQVLLSWNASSGVASYNVKRATVSGGPYTTIASEVTMTNYNDTGLNNGTTYYYVVSAVNSFGEGANSSEVGATPTAGSPPPAPTGLTAVAGNAQVSLNWNASSGAKSYKVKRATVSGGPCTTIASGVATTSYTDTGLNNGTSYYYVISAVNAAGESANSTQASATPSAASGVVPPGAAALGYTLAVINEHPTAADIAPGNNGDYKWFDGQWWESPPPMRDYSTSNGILVMSLGGDLASMPRDFSAGALPLLAGSNGFYVEFDVQLSDNNTDHWPAVWLMPWEHPNADVYPGNPPGYERFMELDVDEGGFGPGLTGTVHSWAGYYPYYSDSAQNPNNVSPVALDRTQMHTFGAGYDPVHQTVSWWVDGVFQMIAGAPYVPVIATQQHFYLILSVQSHGQNLPYLMYVSGVRAYQPPQTSPGSPLGITIQPQDITAGLGWTVGFSVGTTGATTFQWYKNGTFIPGVTNSVYWLTDIQSPDAGTFSVAVSNGTNSVTSGNAVLTVTGPPPPAVNVQKAVLFAWPGLYSDLGYELQSSPSLSPAQWTTVSNWSVSVGGQTKTAIPILSTNRFFRLIKP